jgi:hypothetical protein
MCHCECSVKIHVKFCKRSIRNLDRIWNALSLLIPCNWQVSLAYLMLIFFYEFKLLSMKLLLLLLFWLYTIYSILFVMYSSLYIVNYTLYIIYNILYTIYYIQYTIYSILNSNTMCKPLEPTLYLYILNPSLPWQCLWDNNPSSFPFQISHWTWTFKKLYLIKHERVKNYKQCVMPSSFLQACPSKHLI